MSLEFLNLHPYLNIMLKRKGLYFLTALIMMTLGTLYAYLLPKKYEASSTVFIENSAINDLVKGITVSPSVEDSVRVLTTALNSRSLILSTIKEVKFHRNLKSEQEQEKLVADIQKDTEIHVAGKNEFRVKFRYYDAAIARDYVNALVRNYIEGETASKRSNSYEAADFLKEQIAAYQEKVVKAEADVAKFKASQGGGIDLDAGQLFREIASAQQRVLELQFRGKQLEEERRILLAASDPVTMKLQALQAKLDELRITYTDGFPEVEQVKSQIEALRGDSVRKAGAQAPGAEPSLELRRINAELGALRDNESALQKSISANKHLLGNIPNQKYSLERLEMAKVSQKGMRDLLDVRNNQAELAKQIGMRDKDVCYRVIDPAVISYTPVSPNRKKLLLLNLLARVGSRCRCHQVAGTPPPGGDPADQDPPGNRR